MIEKSQIQYWLRHIAAHVENMHEASTPEKVARVVDKLLTAAPTKKDKNRAITDLAVLILYSEQLALALHEWAATVTLELLRRDGGQGRADQGRVADVRQHYVACVQEPCGEPAGSDAPDGT